MLEGVVYVLLSGDLKRVESPARSFDPKARFLADVPEHTSYSAKFYGNKVLVSPSALRGPNISIMLEELASLGLKYFLRGGTTGAIQPQINLGEIIISIAAVKLEGASQDYALLNYPAVANF